MPVVSTVRSRGATIVVEANAEVLFTRNGPVGNFSRVFSGRVRRFTAALAPGNIRPTWGHEPAAHGRPLKATFTSSTRYDPARLRVFSAVGSTAKYSAFVDQGTGIYNGGSPWRAKILPPTTEFGSDLYESTWRPGGKAVREVWIKGQKPQFFFARGLDKAFKSMGIPTATVPGTATLGGAITSFPDDLANFAGAAIDTGSGSAFRASLDKWRAQRDAAWKADSAVRSRAYRESPAQRRLRDQRLARGAAKRARAKPTAEQAREANRLRQQKFRDHAAKVSGRKIDRTPKAQISAASERERIRFTRALTERYPSARGFDVTDIHYDAGQHRWVGTVRFPNGKTEPKKGREVT